MLNAAGHTVYTPTLTGLGDRAHLDRPGINLETHVEDVLALFEMEDLRDVMLVGHSYAGFVISAVAERAKGRMRSIVYLDAFVPENGKCLLDFVPQPERRASMIKSGQESGYIAPLPLSALGVIREEDLSWATPRLVRQPFGTFQQAIRLSRPAADGIPRAFVACTKPASGTYGQFADVIRKDSTWIFRELQSGHDAMIIDPEIVARFLGELA